MTDAPPLQPAPEPHGRSRLPLAVGLVVVVAIVVAIGAGQGWFGGSGAGSTASPSASVEGVIPADAGVVAEGRAVPVRWAEVASAGGGRVTGIPVAVGDAVAAGDVLVQLDDVAATLEVGSATAALEAARAATARAEAGVDQAVAGVDQAQAGVDQARAGVAQAQAARRGADAGRDALPGAATNAQERQADEQVEQAAADVAVARAQLDAARASLDAARAQLDAARASLDAARAEEQRAATAVSGAEHGLALTAITSPIAGTVVSIEPAVGDLAQPGAPVARVADLSDWRFETSDLSETSIARVRQGAAATITVDGLPGHELAGTVESVGGYGSSVQGDIVFGVVVAPSGGVPEGLRWNMTVTIEIEGEPAN